MIYYAAGRKPGGLALLMILLLLLKRPLHVVLYMAVERFMFWAEVAGGSSVLMRREAWQARSSFTHCHH